MYSSPIYTLFLQQGARHAGIRPAAYGDVRDEYGALVHGAGVVDRSNLAKLFISGADRADWLQGQVTNDVRLLRKGGTLDALVCEATGHVMADCRIWDLGERYLLLAPGVQRHKLLERLETVIVLEDVAVEDASDRSALLSVVGPEVREEWLEGLTYAPTSALRLAGFDVLVAEDDATELAGRLAECAVPVGTAAYEVARIEDAIPVYAVDMDGRTLPQEMGPLFADRNLSFSKGCYTGQETIARIRSRGHTNRTWVGVRCSRKVAVGTAMAGVGTVTSACHSLALDAPIALAMVRNRFAASGTELDIGRVVDLPFVLR